MAFKLFDRVQETSTTTGTGDFTLSGAVTGFRTFASRYSTGDTLYYGIQRTVPALRQVHGRLVLERIRLQTRLHELRYYRQATRTRC